MRAIIDPPTPRSLSERKIPAPIQYNQVIPSDHLTDRDSPPVQTGPPTSLSEVFLKEEDLVLEDRM